MVLARPAAGDAISDAKAKAAAIEAQLTQAQNEMSALSQQYDAARYHLSQINSSIATTKANIAADQKQVANDKATLSKAAVANYISDGTAADAEPDLQRQREDARRDAPSTTRSPRATSPWPSTTCTRRRTR